MESGDDLGFFFFYALIVVGTLVFLYMESKKRKASAAICRELVEQNFSEIRLIVDCVLVKTSTFNRKGLLVLFKDHLSFIPMGKGERGEIPYAQVIRMDASPAFLLVGKQGKKLTIYTNEQKLMFYVNHYLYTALQAALEKLSPMLAVGMTQAIK